MNRKLTFFKTKMTITRKIKIGKIRFFFLFRKFWIFHVNLTTFEIKIQKWSNLHWRSGVGWIERKIKFQIFPIFIFRVMQKKTVKQAILWMPLSANLFRLEFSIQKHAGSRAVASVGGVGGQSPPQEKKMNFFLVQHFSKFHFFFNF